MLYDFIDTTSNISAGNYLPAEAMSFNGVYLENEIDGYRTLSVQGRELASSSINDIEINSKDGTRYKSRKYDPRIITVKYQLISKSNSEFRKAFNKMNSIFAVEQAQIIFNDEPDKFFIGTTQGNHEIEGGSNSVIGEIEIYCADPYKYSIEEKEVSPTLDNGYTFAIDYNGTKIANPRIEFTMNSENGFLGLVDTKGNILEFGNVDEADGVTKSRNEQLVSLDDFYNASDDTGGTDYMHPTHAVKGTLARRTFENNQFLGFGTAGSTDHSSNGGLRTVTIPVDSQGGRGAKNWYAWMRVLFRAVKYQGQTGEMCISFLTDDNKLIAGVNWYKTDCNGNTGDYELWANGKMIKSYAYTTSHLHHQNPWAWDWGYCDLKKEGAKLTFYYWGGYPSYYIPEVENMVCTKIQISMKQYWNRTGNQMISHMGVNQFKFTKLGVNYWVDSRNVFQNGDTAVVNLDDNSFTLNGLSKPNLGKLGNNWDGFSLKPGYNQIQFTHSSWASKPNAVLKYREVFL